MGWGGGGEEIINGVVASGGGMNINGIGLDVIGCGGLYRVEEDMSVSDGGSGGDRC